VSQTLRQLGWPASGSRAPLALVLLVHAYHGEAGIASGRVSRFDLDGRRIEMVSIPRLERWLSECLSPAEVSVMLLRAEGLTHSEIAQQRSASSRTVANQIASASRKLGVSGRASLLSYLARSMPQAVSPGPGGRLACRAEGPAATANSRSQSCVETVPAASARTFSKGSTSSSP
jgi:DNA-binding CsgD family transcriptional regulator